MIELINFTDKNGQAEFCPELVIKYQDLSNDENSELIYTGGAINQTVDKKMKFSCQYFLQGIMCHSFIFINEKHMIDKIRCLHTKINTKNIILESQISLTGLIRLFI